MVNRQKRTRRPAAGSLFRRLAAALFLAIFADPVAAEPAADAFTYEVVYTSEVWRNFAGGLEEDSLYLDNLDATLEIDAERLWGLEDTRIFLYALYNNGRELSGGAVGDLQVVSNIETGVEALRLYEAWIETPVSGNGSLLFGLFDLNSEFDVLDASGLFINSAHGIGTDFAQTGENGPSIFPVTSLALRLHWEWEENWSGRAAVFDGVPGDPDDPGATAIQLGDGDGALLVGELEWSNDRRRVLAGAWRYTAEFEEWPDPSTPGVVRSGDGNGGLYLRGETAVGDTEDGLSVFGRIGVADGAYNIFSEFLSAGLSWEGLATSRPRDTFGIAVAWAEASDQYLQAASGDGREVKLELTYRMPLGERLTLQPDLQYVINPGLDPTIENAWAIGVRFEMVLLQ